MRLADHHRGQILRSEIAHRARAGEAAAAQHGDLIDEFRDFLQFVRDDHDGKLAGMRQIAHETEHLVGLLRGQHRGRFVQHQKSPPQVKLFDDLSLLPLPGRERADLGVQRDLERHAAHELFQLAEFAAPVDYAGHVTARHHEVLGHGHRRHQGEMLVDHAEAESVGIGGPLDRDLVVVHQERARVGAIVTQQAFHQR